VTRPSAELAQLDELILRLVRTVRRPGYRDRILRGVERIPAADALRVLRSIEVREGRGEAPSIRDVAADLEVEQSTASRAVTALVDRGLIGRGAHADDARRVRLSLTDDGREALAKATANRIDVVAEVVEGWPDSELVAFAGLLERFVERYEGIDESTGGGPDEGAGA
jgi:DNA-binding MarR family transcriptional regulator